jgi:NAD(P)-dependent dehydrogenase (short-subunit alcohol dehydrogenase family)
VTGAGSGIGKASALLFAEHGAKVCVCVGREKEVLGSRSAHFEPFSILD